jgi:hypothetical protein
MYPVAPVIKVVIAASLLLDILHSLPVPAFFFPRLRSSPGPKDGYGFKLINGAFLTGPNYPKARGIFRVNL